MSQLTAQKIKDAIKGLFSGLDATDNSVLQDSMDRRYVDIAVTDGGTAGTAQTETPLWLNNTGLNYLVVGAWFHPAVAVTASDTTFATPLVQRRDAAGINNVTVATFTTKTGGGGGSGNLVAFLPFAMTLTAANLIIAPNQVLTVSVAKASTGVAIASATAQSVISVWLEPTN